MQRSRRIAFTDVRGLSKARLADLLSGEPVEVFGAIAAAARHGLVEGQLLLGQCLIEGRGTQADPSAAVLWFGAAAEAGCAEAMNMLGRCHELGWGVTPNDARAAEWYARAANKGLDWAQFNLANLVLRGRGVTPDRRWALSLYQSAADRGHAKAMNMIGRFCEEGWVVPRNMQAALHWYRCAAEGGDFRGQYNLGSLLLGLGRASEAIVWLEKAVRHGTQDFVSAVSAEMLNSNHRGVRALGALAAARRAAPTISSTDRCTSVTD